MRVILDDIIDCVHIQHFSIGDSGLNHFYLLNSLPQTAANQGYFQAMICNVAM